MPSLNNLFSARKSEETKKAFNDIDKLKKDINKDNKNINSQLFGGIDTTNNDFNDTSKDPQLALEQKLKNINNKYKEVTGSNIMEFFNKQELNNASSDDNNASSKNNRNKNKMDQILRNSNGEFFLEEKDRFFRYEDYRLIDSYIPEVSKCIDLYRDCILSPDDLTKKSLEFFYDEISLSGDKEETEFIVSNLNQLKKTYKLEKKFKNDLREVLLLGDLFYLVMPYETGFNKILKEDDIFINHDDDLDNYGLTLTENLFDFENDDNFQELFKEEKALSNKSKKSQQYEEDVKNAKKDILDSINNNIKYFKDPIDLISDIKQEKNSSNQELNVDINGSIFKKIEPENILKLELDDQVLGYIYVEKTNATNGNRTDNPNASPNSLRSSTTGSTINTTDSLGYGTNDVFNSRYDYLQRDQSRVKTKYELISSIFVKGISKKINKDFLKKNQEFKELIYSLIYNEYITKKQIKMTFIEPQYIFHFSLNSSGVYGISKCSKALFFSKIYLATLLTNLMQKIIRGRD